MSGPSSRLVHAPPNRTRDRHLEAVFVLRGLVMRTPSAAKPGLPQVAQNARTKAAYWDCTGSVG
jgi:hypothetical protein